MKDRLSPNNPLVKAREAARKKYYDAITNLFAGFIYGATFMAGIWLINSK